MTEDPINKLKKKMWENRNSLNIARLPNKTKEAFVNLAKEEFCEDYGMALREILNYYFEHHAMRAIFFQNIDMKLDQILDNIPQKEETEEKPETKEIKLVNGTRIVKGGKE